MRASVKNDPTRTVVEATGPQLTKSNQLDPTHHQETDTPTTVARVSLHREGFRRVWMGQESSQGHGLAHGGPETGAETTSFSWSPPLVIVLCVLRKYKQVGRYPLLHFFLNPSTYVPNLLLPGKRRKELNVCII